MACYLKFQDHRLQEWADCHGFGDLWAKAKDPPLVGPNTHFPQDDKVRELIGEWCLEVSGVRAPVLEGVFYDKLTAIIKGYGDASDR